MEMHQFRYLEAVAKCGSIMAAAASCHVSQPALSVQLKKLEEELGAELLVRSARGVSLTPAGERALVTARRILREASSLRSDAKHQSFAAPSVVRISIQPYLATEILPKVLTNMEEDAMKGGRLEFRERPPSQLVEAVANGGSDLGILDVASVPVRDLLVEEFLRVRYALYCHKDHPLAQKPRLRLANLPHYPLILFELCPGLSSRLHSIAAHKGIELRIPFTTELAVTAFEMLVDEIGVSVLPLTLQSRAARRQIVARPIEDYEEVARICAIRRPGSELSAGAEALVERFRQKLVPKRSGLH